MNDYAYISAEALAAAAAAAQANAAYRAANNLPIDPTNTAILSNPATQQYLAQKDDAAEMAKHAAAWAEPRNDVRTAPQAALDEYARQRGNTITGEGTYRQPTYTAAARNPYNPNTAAGIAWDVTRQGGEFINPYVRSTAYAEGYQGDLVSPVAINPITGRAVVDTGRHTVPIRDLSSGFTDTPLFTSPGGTVTTYVPYGNYAQTELLNTKIALDFNTGELAIYQQPFGHSIFNLAGGGGRNALQSGMFTINEPETAFIVKQGDVGTYKLPSGAGLSRLGAEAYGGYVMPLDNRTLSPDSAFSQYPGNANNLANFVNPQGPNMSRTEAPGAKIPWSISTGSPAMQYMDERGIIQGGLTVPGGNLIGGNIVVGNGTTTTVSRGSLPGPFGTTITSISKFGQESKFDLPGPAGTTVTSISRIGHIDDMTPKAPAQYEFSPVSNGGLLDTVGFGMLATGTMMATNTENFFTSAEGFIPSGPLSPVKAGLGFFEAIPQTVAMIPLIGGAAYVYGKNPSWGNQQIIPLAAAMGAGMWTRATTQPERTFGNLLGMAALPGAAESAMGELPVRSPISLKIGTPIRSGTEGEFNYVSTFGYRNPFTNEIPVVKAYTISGADVSGIKYGFGPPTTAMRDLTVVADPMFNVRDMTGAHVMGESQRLILDPFFRDVSRGTTEGPLVNAMFDMKANIGANIRGGSEEFLRYTNAQPAGTLTQTGIDAPVQTQVHEVLADAGAIRLGSAAQTDWLGPRFMRSTVSSDIDIDIPKANYPRAIEDLKFAYSQNIEPVRMPQSGGKFSLMKNPESETIISPGTTEKFQDVRSLKTTTITGKEIGQQTPEYGIESKASRSLGGRILSYYPETGVRATIHAEKFSKDLADIYAASRGIARTAYEQNQFRMGETYEGISNNLRIYADSRGMGDIIRTIPEDILQTPEAIAAKAKAGIKAGVYKPQVFGMDIPTIGRSESEYPIAHYIEAPSRSTAGYPLSIGTGIAIARESIIAPYPASTATEIIRSTGQPYPVSTQSRPDQSWTIADEIYPGSRISQNDDIKQIGGYPAATYNNPSSENYPLSFGDEYPAPQGGIYPTSTRGANYPGGYAGNNTNTSISYFGSGGGTLTGLSGGGGTVIITKPTDELPYEWQKSHRRRRPARFLELFSFEMGIDTPIPKRFGLGGVNEKALARNPNALFIEGFRGYAGSILSTDDTAPNRLFDIMGTGPNRQWKNKRMNIIRDRL